MPSTSPPPPATLTVVLAFAAIYLIWGSTFFVALIALETLPPFLLMALRLTLAGALLYGVSRLGSRRVAPLFTWRRNALSGILMLGVGSTSVVWAEQFVPSGLAAMLVTTLPLWLAVLDRPQWASYRHAWARPAGLVLGAGGVGLLFSEHPGTWVSAARAAMFWPAVGSILAGCISTATGALYTRYRPATGDVVSNAAAQLLAAGLFCGLVSGLASEWAGFSVSQVSGRSYLALGYGVVLGSSVAYLAYVWLLRIRPAAVVGTYAYVNPVVAVALGRLLAHEPVTARQLVALVLILTGVLLLNQPAKGASAAATT